MNIFSSGWLKLKFAERHFRAFFIICTILGFVFKYFSPTYSAIITGYPNLSTTQSVKSGIKQLAQHPSSPIWRWANSSGSDNMSHIYF